MEFNTILLLIFALFISFKHCEILDSSQAESEQKQNPATSRWATVRKNLHASRFVKAVGLSRQHTDVMRYLSSLIKPGQYTLPDPLTAVVFKTENDMNDSTNKNGHGNKEQKDGFFIKKRGIFKSTDATVLTILDYVTQRLKKDYPENYKDLKFLQLPQQGCYLSFSLDKEEIFNKAFLFEFANTMTEEKIEQLIDEKLRTKAFKKKIQKENEKFGKRKEKDDEEEEEEEEEEEKEPEEVVQLSTYSILVALQKGRKGFGPNAYMDWSDLPDEEAEESLNEKERKQGFVKKFLKKMVLVYQKLLNKDSFQKELEKVGKDKKMMFLEDSIASLNKQLADLNYGEKLQRKGELLVKLEEVKKEISACKMKNFIKAELLSQGKKAEKKKTENDLNQTRKEKKKYKKALKKELKSVYDNLKKIDEVQNRLFRYQLEKDLEEEMSSSEEKENKGEKGDIMLKVMNKLKTEIERMEDKEKQEKKFLLKKQIEFYQIEMEHYKSGLEMDLAMNGLNNSSKTELIEQTNQFISDKLDNMEQGNKKELMGNHKMNKIKKDISQKLYNAVFTQKIRLPKDLLNRLKTAVDDIKGMQTGLKEEIKNYIGENIAKRVVPMKNRIEILDDMEREIKSMEQELNFFQKMLHQKAAELGIEEEEIKERKIEVLREMTDEMESRIETMQRDEKEKLQGELLNQVAMIRLEIGKHKLKEALEGEFEKMEQDFGNDKEGVEEQKSNLLREKRAEMNGLKERLKEIRYRIKPKVEITEPKHPYDFVQNVQFVVSAKPAGKEFQNMPENFFEQMLNHEKRPESIIKPNKEVYDLFEGKIKKLDDRSRNCVMLKNLVNKALYSASDDATAEVLRARLGAQVLSSVLNSKRFTADLALALLGSLGGAGTIAYLLDTFAWPALILALHITQPHSPLFIIAACLLNSLTALFGETFDSAVIKKFLDTLKGGNFMPESWKEGIKLLKDSAVAGGIASVGSIPLNLIVMFHSWYLLPMAAVANQIATSTAGAMIPLEVSKMQRYTKAAFLLKTQSGFYAKPDNDELQEIKQKLIKRKKTNKAFATFKKHVLRDNGEVTDEHVYQEFVRLRIKLAMTLGKASSFATTSMGIGSFLGFITWLPVFSLAKIGFVSESWQRIVSIMVNTPTEIYSFTLGTITANLMRNKTFSSWWATDAVKSEKMVELIFEKAIKQMNTMGEPFEEISDKEIYKIYITKLSAYRYGHGVVKTMNFVIGGIGKVFDKIREAFGFQVPPGLLEGIDISQVIGPEEMKSDEDNEEDDDDEKETEKNVKTARKISYYTSAFSKKSLKKWLPNFLKKKKNVAAEYSSPSV